MLNYDTNCIPGSGAAFSGICIQALSGKPKNIPFIFWNGLPEVRLVTWRQKV